jgi:hypothetical protein
LTPEVDLALQTLMQSALAQLTEWVDEASELTAPAKDHRVLEFVIQRRPCV